MTSMLPIVRLPGFPAWTVRDRLPDRSLRFLPVQRKQDSENDWEFEDVQERAATDLARQGDPVPFALLTLRRWRTRSTNEISTLIRTLERIHAPLLGSASAEIDVIYLPKEYCSFEEGGTSANQQSLTTTPETQLLQLLEKCRDIIGSTPEDGKDAPSETLQEWTTWRKVVLRSISDDGRSRNPLLDAWLSGCELVINYETNEACTWVNWLHGDLE